MKMAQLAGTQMRAVREGQMRKVGPARVRSPLIAKLSGEPQDVGAPVAAALRGNRYYWRRALRRCCFENAEDRNQGGPDFAAARGDGAAEAKDKQQANPTAALTPAEPTAGGWHCFRRAGCCTILRTAGWCESP